MTYDELRTQIFYRFWRCNELTKDQAEAYADIAVNEMRRCMPLAETETFKPIPNKALQGAYLPGMSAVRQSEEDAA